MTLPPPRRAEGPPRRGPPPWAERPTTPKKRMMAQGRKTHFFFDLRELLASTKMPEAQWRSFGETLFAKGARGSTDEAKDWLWEKVQDETLEEKDGERIANLVERYSFWR